MKTARTMLAAAAISAIINLSALSAFGQAGPVIRFDENGNGNYNGIPLSFALTPDPFSGIITLQYKLPPGILGSPGDLVLIEPQTGENSDIVRWDGQGSLWFFSEREATDLPPFDLADVAQLPPILTQYQPVIATEVGPEGQNGYVYTPLLGQPGFDSANPNLTYSIISDIPEPAAGILLGLGALLGLMKARGMARA